MATVQIKLAACYKGVASYCDLLARLHHITSFAYLQNQFHDPAQLTADGLNVTWKDREFHIL